MFLKEQWNTLVYLKSNVFKCQFKAVSILKKKVDLLKHLNVNLYSQFYYDKHTNQVNKIPMFVYNRVGITKTVRFI